MILLHKKFLCLVPVYIVYIAVVQWITLFACARSGNSFLTQAFTDKVYCYLLAPPFLMGIYFLDECMKKPAMIRIGNRRRALLHLLAGQYLFAAVYLAGWFIMATLFAGGGGEDISAFGFPGKYMHCLCGLILLVNCCELFKRLVGPATLAVPFGAGYIWLLLDVFMIPSMTNRFPFGPTVYLGIAWVFSAGWYSYGILAGWIVFTFILLLRRNERYDMF